MAHRRKPSNQRDVTLGPDVLRRMHERTGTEDELREFLQEAMKDPSREELEQRIAHTEDRPYVPPPPGWGRQPVIGPGGEMGRMLRVLDNIAPGILEGASSITVGPNSSWIRRMLNENPTLLGGGKSKKTPLPRTNRKGTFDPRTDEIYVDAHGHDADLFNTLTHELLHGFGAEVDEPRSYEGGDLAKKFWGVQRRIRGTSTDAPWNTGKR
jgi:hypothetical protein